MEEKYYLISGKALANVQFRCSGRWYESNETFANERISERDLKKYARFLSVAEGSKRETLDPQIAQEKPKMAFATKKEEKTA